MALPAQLEWIGDERYRRVHKRKYVSNTVTVTSPDKSMNFADIERDARIPRTYAHPPPR
jgi:hypothetical protein